MEPYDTDDPRPVTSRRDAIVRGFGMVGAAAVAGSVLGRFTGVLDAGGHPLADRPAIAGSTAQRLGAPPVEFRRPESGRLAFPVDPSANSFVLDNFGDCRGGGARRHQGIDVISERGAPVYAVADGVLHTQYTDTGTAGFGWTLRDESTTTAYRYFHLDSFAPGLDTGSRVRFGDVIGYVGSSGNLIWVDGERVEDRSNIHLHFEVLMDYRRAVDPLSLLEVPDQISVGNPLKSCSHLG